jgi:hypothetical protein
MEDYTRLFSSPDELADFLMLEVEEQDRLMAEFALAGRLAGVSLACRIDEPGLGGEGGGEPMSAKPRHLADTH